MHNLPMTINGQDWAENHDLMVVNPATAKVIGHVPNSNSDALQAAIDAARAAFPSWSRTCYAERQGVLRAIGATIQAHAPELAHLLTEEQGKSIDAALSEIETAAQWAIATASLTLPITLVEDTPEHRVETRHVPIGVVGAISPWNFPVLLSVWKIVPALLAGNTMVLKPSPFTPLTVLRLGELLRPVLPKGVLNIITGDDQLGPQMTQHPEFDKISFTGSSATGRRVMESASATLKRVTLELGGNDPAIVFPDVDITQTAEQLFWSAFTNSGQICVATKRAYIHADIYEAMRDALANLVRTAVIGNGAHQGTLLGPVQNAQQFRRVQTLLHDCQENDYPLIQGSCPQAADGYYIPLTLVDNPPQKSRIVQEEQFGPILPLIRFTDEAEVIGHANASEYGLAATVWTKDEERALRVASQLEAGSVWINEALALSPFATFGGHKQSGLGKENGLAGLLEYTNAKTITIRRAAVAASTAKG